MEKRETVDLRDRDQSRTVAAEPPPDLLGATVASLPTPGIAQVDPGSATLEDSDFDGRYRQRTELGRGGMGVVKLCEDRRIGRQVAMKVLLARGAQATLQERFLREARLQGQLEHPAVVPVYDLGMSPDGEPFFTMKRIRGTSLEEIVRGLHSGRQDVAGRFSLRRLLAAFSSICLAIDFAHRSGVIHRDLKPANIMLGDFGEVYVLDWGVARIGGTPEPEAPAPDDAPAVPIELGQSGALTAAGALIGTPGYMSPEQVRGETETITPRADVYALGAILFELLAHEPLHQGGNPGQVLLATLQGADAALSRRRPEREVPPELEAICVRATAHDPSDRFESTRAMHEALERFLDGDRDQELRRQLAATYTAQAEEATARALATGVEEDRRSALQAVGRALALDPESPAARGGLMRLLTEPPRETPREAELALVASANESARHVYRVAAIAYVAWALLLLPLTFGMGVRQWVTCGLCWAPLFAATALSILAIRPGRASARMGLAIMLLSVGGISVGSRMFGPFILIPGLTAMTALIFTIQPYRWLRVTTVVASCLGVALPFLLELVGVLPPSYLFADGRLQVLPQMQGLPRGLTLALLLLSGVGFTITSSWFTGHIRDLLTRAERSLQLQAWQLRQLVGDQAKPGARRGSEPAQGTTATATEPRPG